MLWQLSQIVVTTLPCSNITPTLSLSQVPKPPVAICFFLRPTRRAGLSLNSVSVQFYLYSGFFYRDTVTGHFAEETGRKIGQKHQAWTPKTASNWAQKKWEKKYFFPVGKKNSRTVGGTLLPLLGLSQHGEMDPSLPPVSLAAVLLSLSLSFPFYNCALSPMSYFLFFCSSVHHHHHHAAQPMRWGSLTRFKIFPMGQDDFT